MMRSGILHGTWQTLGSGFIKRISNRPSELINLNAAPMHGIGVSVACVVGRNDAVGIA